MAYCSDAGQSETLGDPVKHWVLLRMEPPEEGKPPKGKNQTELCSRVHSVKRVIANIAISKARFSRGFCTPVSFLRHSSTRYKDSFQLQQDPGAGWAWVVALGRGIPMPESLEEEGEVYAHLREPREGISCITDGSERLPELPCASLCGGEVRGMPPVQIQVQTTQVKRTGQSLRWGQGLQTVTISTKSDGAKKGCFVAVVCSAPGSCWSPWRFWHRQKPSCHRHICHH